MVLKILVDRYPGEVSGSEEYLVFIEYIPPGCTRHERSTVQDKQCTVSQAAVRAVKTIYLMI